MLFERGKRLMSRRELRQQVLHLRVGRLGVYRDIRPRKAAEAFRGEELERLCVEHLKNGIIASGAILQYLIMTQHTQIGHVTSLARIEENKYVRLDRFTVRSLELMGSMNDGGSSLLNVIDKTISPMGARLLKRWLVSC